MCRGKVRLLTLLKACYVRGIQVHKCETTILSESKLNELSKHFKVLFIAVLLYSICLRLYGSKLFSLRSIIHFTCEYIFSSKTFGSQFTNFHFNVFWL